MKDMTEQGIQHYVARRFAEAEPYLQRAVKLNPNIELNRYRLGVCLCELRRYAEAEPHLQRAVELNPKDDANHSWLRICHIGMGKVQKTSERLSTFVHTMSDRPSIIHQQPTREDPNSKILKQIQLGISLYQNNEFSEAIPLLKLGIDLNPRDEMNFYRLGLSFYKLRQYDMARPYLERAVELEPNDESNQYLLGASLYNLNQFSEAEPHLQRAVELNHFEENCCYLLGCCLYKLERYGDAVVHLQRSVDLKPTDNREQVSSNKKWLQKCLEKLAVIRTRLDESNPNIEEEINLGISLFEDSQYLEAIPYLRIAVNERPDDEMTQYHLGSSFYELGQHHEAQPHLQRAVELKPEDEMNQYFLGMCFYKQEKYQEAQPHLQRAVDLQPDDETNQYALGMCFYKQEKYQEAQPHLQRAVDLQPDDETNQYALGMCFYRQVKYIEAQPHLQRAVDLQPDDEVDRYILGVTFCRMEKYNEAEPHLQRAVDLKPNDDRGADTTNRDWLNKCQSNLPHRVTVADIFEEALARNSGDSIAFGDLGVTRLYQKRYAEALALFREALRLSPADFYKIQIVECYERLGNIELAQQMRLEYPELFEVITTEPNEELPTAPTFSEFLSSGSTWLDGAGWENRQHSPLLKSLHQQGAKWSDLTKVLFPEYDIEEDDLAETLARAESLQQHLHLETEMPVYLQTEWVSVAMTIENGWIRAWVGIELDGCAVSLNPSTWDVQFLNGDRDALFAAAVVVNWYIDCSIMLTAHPKFCKESENNGDENRPWHLSDNGWAATSLFSDDVDDIREGRQIAPPRAHRVRGHIRSLTQREPTDDARAKAPAHKRAFMGPNDTWVQAHARGGQTETQNLLTRLHKHSSLADFLATAQLDSD
jgi:tetratricopeptide (TPR) repeat protein